ncbi:MAG: HAMP domain-containing histidine kinase [Microscillaceae bacterium]|nr:HAMP domain-containing histidine kinase [Microscillaceae bacterium]
MDKRSDYPGINPLLGLHQGPRAYSAQLIEVDTTVWLVLLISSLGFSLGLYLLFRNERYANLRLRDQNQARSIQNQEINAQKMALEALNEEKENVMRSVAHDLKAPLNRIFGLANVISLDEENLSIDQKKYLNLIRQVANEARNMIQNWLDIKAIEDRTLKIHISELNLSQLVDDLLLSYEEVAHKKGIVLHKEMNLSDETIKSDSAFLSRILDNLISNAIKFSPLNKNVYLKIKDSPQEIIFSIQDEGVGIDEAERDKLFQKFQKLSTRPTAGESSTGLGLSIVKNLVDELKGKVLVESEVGVGTTFHVILPKQTTPDEMMVNFK